VQYTFYLSDVPAYSQDTTISDVDLLHVSFCSALWTTFTSRTLQHTVYRVLTNVIIRVLCCLAEELATRVVGSSVSDSRGSVTFLSQCLPVLDEICRRSLNFVRSCIRQESAFVRFLTLHGLHARSRSLFGRGILCSAVQLFH